MNPVPPEINVDHPGAPLLIGRDPGENEVEYRYDEAEEKVYPNGRPFVGKAGEELERVLAELGMPRRRVNIANVVGHRPPENIFKKHDDRHVQEGLADLRRLARRLKPSLIICLGNEASWAILGDQWPTSGRGVYGAKGIEDRRGYFWDSEYGPVLTTLHPAGVLRKQVPGRYLLETDFRRARKWLRGKLPREIIPDPRRLDMAIARKLMSHSLLGWDIETRWGMTTLFCSGLCGDDLVPYIGLYPRDREAIWALLTSGVPLVGHNGDGFDLPAMKLNHNVDVRGYNHDTQHMWWALEPELAAQDEEEESSEGGKKTSRMTRKGLAFLASVYDFNVPWWKQYPEGESDPDHDEKLVKVNAGDIWVTRQLASSMLPEIEVEGVTKQYVRSMEMVPGMVRKHLRGLKVNDQLRQERSAAISGREKELEIQSAEVALKYIKEKELQYFCEWKKCRCCGGGKVQAKRCWRCAGMEKEPSKKQDYYSVWAVAAKEGAFIEAATRLLDGGPHPFSKVKVAELKALLPECKTCGGKGKTPHYDFNPFSGPQLRRLLYEEIGVPKSYQKGNKETLDEAALKKIVQWAMPVEGK